MLTLLPADLGAQFTAVDGLIVDIVADWHNHAFDGAFDLDGKKPGMELVNAPRPVTLLNVDAPKIDNMSISKDMSRDASFVIAIMTACMSMTYIKAQLSHEISRSQAGGLIISSFRLGRQ